MKQWQRRDYTGRTIYVYYKPSNVYAATSLQPNTYSWLLTNQIIDHTFGYQVYDYWDNLVSSELIFSLSILQGLLTCWRTSPKSDRYLINPAERPSVSLPSRQRWTQCLVESTTIDRSHEQCICSFFSYLRLSHYSTSVLATSWPVRLSRVSVSLSPRRWWISLYFYSKCYWGSLRKRRVQQSGIVTVPEYDVMTSMA